jgi:hypothetical protein
MLPSSMLVRLIVGFNATTNILFVTNSYADWQNFIHEMGWIGISLDIT